MLFLIYVFSCLLNYAFFTLHAFYLGLCYLRTFGGISPPNNLSSLEVAQFEKGQKKHSSHPTKSSFIEEINEKYA